MPDREVRKLDGSAATRVRSAIPLGPSAALIVGFGLVAAGVCLALVGAGVIPVEAEQEAPGWVLESVGGAFALIGLLVGLTGVAGFARQARYKREIAKRPSDYWLADYPWDPLGTKDDCILQMRRSLFWLVFMVLFLSPFNYFAFLYEESPPCFVMGIVGLFDLVVVSMLWHLIYLTLRWLKYGRSWLKFERFPFFRGEGFDATFGATRGIGRFEKLTFALRCVEERREVSGSGDDRSEHIVRYQLYCDEYCFDRPGELPARAADLPIHFELPADLRSTDMSARPPTYWELEIIAVTPGIDYNVAFLVPVYARRTPDEKTPV